MMKRSKREMRDRSASKQVQPTERYRGAQETAGGDTHYNAGAEEQIWFASFRTRRRRTCCKGRGKYDGKMVWFLLSDSCSSQPGKAWALDLFLDSWRARAVSRTWQEGVGKRVVTGDGMLQQVRQRNWLASTGRQCARTGKAHRHDG